MPLTLSHPAAVLPLRRLGLPVTAMVVGSMVPDLPLFFGWPRGYQVSHSLVGVATVDATATLIAVGLWFMVARDALVDLSPDIIRSRLAANVKLAPRQWLLVVPAAWMGALTHVAWDGFTHPGRWGVDQVAWLQHQHAGLVGYKWAQYVSGVLGLAIVCLATISYLRELAPVRRRTPRPSWATGLLLSTGAVVAASVVVTASLNASSGLHAVAFHSVVNAILSTLGCVMSGSLIWRGTRLAAPDRPVE